MKDNKNRRISTFGSRITSLVSVTLVLVLLGVSAMAGIAGKNITDEVRRHLGFIIKMERGCSDSNINLLKQSLLSCEAVDLLTFTSADDIMAQESEFLGEDIAATLDSNPYSPEFDIRVKPAYASADSIEALSMRYSGAAGVSEIVTESAIIEGVDSTLRRASSIVLIVALILLAVSVALINNTISLSIYARRFVIHTMKLVGAKGSFIRRPFVQAGLASGIIAGVCAAAVLVGLRYYTASVDPMLETALPLGATALVCVLLVAAGCVICTLTAVFATNRYLRASYDEMFLK